MPATVVVANCMGRFPEPGLAYDRTDHVQRAPHRGGVGGYDGPGLWGTTGQGGVGVVSSRPKGEVFIDQKIPIERLHGVKKIRYQTHGECVLYNNRRYIERRSWIEEC